MLVELEPDRPIGVFQYSGMRLYVADLLNGAADVVNRKTLKPLLRESILREAINAF